MISLYGKPNFNDHCDFSQEPFSINCLKEFRIQGPWCNKPSLSTMIMSDCEQIKQTYLSVLSIQHSHAVVFPTKQLSDCAVSTKLTR